MTSHDRYVQGVRTFRWLVGHRFSLSRFTVILSVWYATALAICWFDGSLWIEGHVGLLQDLVMAVLYFLLVGLVGAARLVLQRLEETLDHLPHVVRAQSVVSIDDDRGAQGVQDDVERIRSTVATESTLGRRWHSAFLAIFAMLVYVFQVHIPLFAPQPVRAWPMWPERFPLSFGFGLAWALFYWVLVIGNAAWFAMSSAATSFVLLRRYAREGRLLVVPVAPDGKGGLAVLGRFSFSLSLLASTGLTFVVAWLFVFGLDLALLIGFLVYIVALASLFFVPLLSVHHAMQEARETELTRLGALFRHAYAQLPAHDDEETMRAAPAEIRHTVHYLGHLDRLYRRAESMPVWPFNLATLSQFFTLVIVPLLLFVVQAASENWLTEQLRRLVP